MKQLIPLVKSHIYNSNEVIQDLKNLDIPENALIFSADAKSMYTNIDTEIGVASIRDLILQNNETLQDNFPTELFLQVLKIVMNNNIFTFANTYWLQLSGTAMGTPSACLYATTSFGQHENTQILPRFSQNLKYYRRYIDDILGIWVPSDAYNTTWPDFIQVLNNWGHLEWIVEQPSNKTTFLDLNLELHNGKIETSTYQKTMNLYLYIPPLSAHPPSCLKGLIFGELQRYWNQNNNDKFQIILAKFIERLYARGHKLENLIPILTAAAINIHRRQLNWTPKTDKDDNTLYIHWTFQPHGIQRKDLRHIYNTTLATAAGFKNMTVAMARPRNLRDILAKTPLALPPNINIQTLMEATDTP